MTEKRIVAIIVGDPDPHNDGDIIAYAETELSQIEIEDIYNEVVKKWDSEELDEEYGVKFELGDLPEIVAHKIGTVIEIESHRRDV